MKRIQLTFLIGILLVIIFGCWLCLFQVRSTEVALVTTFGKPTRPKSDPGLYVKAPWPIENVHRFDKRMQNFEDHLTEGLTKDNFNLLTSVYAGWKITDPSVFFPKFADAANPISEAEKDLERLLGNAKSAVVGKHPLSDFISTTDNGASFVAIEREILVVVQAQVRANNYGLDIDFLGIKKLQLPENVTQPVFDRMTSERKVLAERSQSEGESEAQKIRSEADRKAAEILANAEGEATQIRGKGEAEAAQWLAVFQQNPDLANFIFRLNALESSLRDRSILIFDQHTPPFDLLRGPAGKLTDKP
jgi:membrane protease subunit HflC